MKLLTIKELSNGLYENTSMDWTFSVASIFTILLTLVFILFNIDNIACLKDVASLCIKSMILAIISFLVIAHICLYFHMCMYYIPPKDND